MAICTTGEAKVRRQAEMENKQFEWQQEKPENRQSFMK
jgi:hypothetical protein